MRRFGSDKPDTRFGLEIEDATEVTRGSEFGVFASAPRQCASSRAAGALAADELARLEEVAKEWGAKGLAYLVCDEEGEVRSPIAKFLSEARARGVPRRSRHDRPLRRRHVGDDRHACPRRDSGSHLGRELELIDGERLHVSLGLRLPDVRARRGGRVAGRACTIPSPRRRRTGGPGSTRIPAHALRTAYDLIVNGSELGGGQLPDPRAEIQSEGVRTCSGSAEDERATKFGFLLDALAMGAPPHGGFAMGIDRMIDGARRRAEHPRRDRVPEEPRPASIR